ncbi:MAG TPA: trypsin-like peptidase domain-containing protein [bacterium]|nr:trypsin-like peptidase domain-containing protein [bacterium]
MMDVARSLSDALAQAVEAAEASVVRVEARRHVPSSGVVWSADGVIVTAAHAIELDDGIRVGTADGRVVDAALVGRDPSTDLAVLRAEAKGLKAPAWVPAGEVKVGQLVLALARPGRTVRARSGIIGALGETWRTPRGGEIDRYIEPDVRASWGFSGGPLVDLTGRVIGLNSSGLMRHGLISVPQATVARVTETLLRHGRIRRGYLGIGAHPVRVPATLRQQVGQETGLIVVSVEAGSPAERGGVLLGDVIVGIGGAPVSQLNDLMSRLSSEAVGTKIRLRLIRGGAVQEIEVTVGER